MHLLGPLAIYLFNTQPAPARMKVLDADALASLDPLLGDPLRASVAAVREVGFGEPVYTGGIPGMSFDSVVALFERPDGRAIGFISVAHGFSIPLMVVLTLSTRFADGRLLVTTNFDAVTRVPPRPDVDGIVVPSHLALAHVWAVHRHRIEKYERRHARPPMTRGHDPIGHEYDELCALQDMWIRSGHAKRLSGGELGWTLKGASQAAWRGLWPWKQRTERRNARRTAEAVQDMPMLQ